MTAHSRLAPSSAERWAFCPGSVQLSEQFPALTVDPSAAEGEAAHWVAYSMLKTHTPAVGDLAPNGVMIDEEMIEAGRLYFNLVFAISNPHGGLTRVRLEERERMPSIHPDMFGTPDGVIDLCELNGELHVVDFKYGHGEVDPFENWQLASYARGVLDRLGFDGSAEQHLTLVFHIVQPRCYSSDGPIRQWRVKAADLRGMWNKLHHAAHEALGDNPGFAVGSHCKHCPARRACPTLRRNAQYAMDLPGLGLAHELPADALGLELAFIQRQRAMLEAFEMALKEQAEQSIRSGQSVPGWALEAGKGSTKWNVPDSEVLMLGQLMEVDLAKPTAPITPTQATALLRKKRLDESVIAAYSERVPGAQRLVTSTKTLASKVFGAKQNGNN